jgi:hypothetical protein
MPPRAAPPRDDWPRLWARTVALDPDAVPSFLITREEALYDRPLLLVNVLASALQTFSADERQALRRFYRAQRSPAPGTGLTKLSLEDFNALLDRFRQEVQARIGRHPVLALLLRPEVARGWEGFLYNFLNDIWTRDDAELSEEDVPAARRGEFADLLATHFGPAYDLVCPRAWD